MVRKLSPRRAVETLPYTGKAAALPLAKAINSAIANAKEKGVSESNLVFKEIQINDGPRLKRGRAVGHGRWHPYQKKMSHIRVVLTTKEPEIVKKAKEKKELDKGSKSKIKPGLTKSGKGVKRDMKAKNKVSAKGGK